MTSKKSPSNDDLLRRLNSYKREAFVNSINASGNSSYAETLATGGVGPVYFGFGFDGNLPKNGTAALKATVYASLAKKLGEVVDAKDFVAALSSVYNKAGEVDDSSPIGKVFAKVKAELEERTGKKYGNGKNLAKLESGNFARGEVLAFTSKILRNGKEASEEKTVEAGGAFDRLRKFFTK